MLCEIVAVVVNVEVVVVVVNVEVVVVVDVEVVVVFNFEKSPFKCHKVTSPESWDG